MPCDMKYLIFVSNRQDTASGYGSANVKLHNEKKKQAAASLSAASTRDDISFYQIRSSNHDERRLSSQSWNPCLLHPLSNFIYEFPRFGNGVNT